MNSESLPCGCSEAGPCGKHTPAEPAPLSQVLKEHKLLPSDLAGWYGRCSCGADLELDEDWARHIQLEIEKVPLQGKGAGKPIASTAPPRAEPAGKVTGQPFTIRYCAGWCLEVTFESQPPGAIATHLVSNFGENERQARQVMDSCNRAVLTTRPAGAAGGEEAVAKARLEEFEYLVAMEWPIEARRLALEEAAHCVETQTVGGNKAPGSASRALLAQAIRALAAAPASQANEFQPPSSTKGSEKESDK